MKIRVLSSVAIMAFFALACTGGTETTTTTTEAPPAPTTPAATTTTATGDVGVASCDQYIKEMTACFSSMDAATKAALEASFKQTTDAWRAAAATPEGKAGLDAACQAALTAMPPNCKAGGAAPAAGGPAAGAPGAGGPGAAAAAPGTAPAADAAKTDDKDEHDGAHKQGQSIGRDNDGKRKEGKRN